MRFHLAPYALLTVLAAGALLAGPRLPWWRESDDRTTLDRYPGWFLVCTPDDGCWSRDVTVLPKLSAPAHERSYTQDRNRIEEATVHQQRNHIDRAGRLTILGPLTAAMALLAGVAAVFFRQRRRWRTGIALLAITAGITTAGTAMLLIDTRIATDIPPHLAGGFPLTIGGALATVLLGAIAGGMPAALRTQRGSAALALALLAAAALLETGVLAASWWIGTGFRYRSEISLLRGTTCATAGDPACLRGEESPLAAAIAYGALGLAIAAALVAAWVAGCLRFRRRLAPPAIAAAGAGLAALAAIAAVATLAVAPILGIDALITNLGAGPFLTLGGCLIAGLALLAARTVLGTPELASMHRDG